MKLLHFLMCDVFRDQQKWGFLLKCVASSARSYFDRVDQGSHRSSLAGSPLACGRGSPSGAREDGLDINGSPGASPSSTCASTASGSYVRE